MSYPVCLVLPLLNFLTSCHICYKDCVQLNTTTAPIPFFTKFAFRTNIKLKEYRAAYLQFMEHGIEETPVLVCVFLKAGAS